jgi:hypothetical protein
LCFSSSESEIEIGSIYSVGLASLLGFLKLYLFKVSLQSISFFQIASKAFSSSEIGKDLLKENE